MSDRQKRIAIAAAVVAIGGTVVLAYGPEVLAWVWFYSWGW